MRWSAKVSWSDNSFSAIVFSSPFRRIFVEFRHQLTAKKSWNQALIEALFSCLESGIFALVRRKKLPVRKRDATTV